MFAPKVEILPPSQRTLWDELGQTPKEFVLYEGTALALRLGHRRSEDFDFFSNNPFAPEPLRSAIPYLQGAEVSQFEANTLTAIVTRGGPVKVSLFGGLRLNRVQDPDLVRGNGVQVASLLDVAATNSQPFSSERRRGTTRILRRLSAPELACLKLSRRRRPLTEENSMGLSA